MNYLWGFQAMVNDNENALHPTVLILQKHEKIRAGRDSKWLPLIEIEGNSHLVLQRFLALRIRGEHPTQMLAQQALLIQLVICE